jgi:parvulin-like peptidyl-prolyl isomerase
MATAEKTLRDGVKVQVYEQNLDSKNDETRADSTPLSEAGTDTITWGEIKDKIIATGKGATVIDPLAFEDSARRAVLENEIDLRIMAQKARQAGLDQDPLYTKRVSEYTKTLLTNMHRQQLAKQMQPADDELKAYYEANRNRFVIPEARKLQMVVVKEKAQAESIKADVDAGKTTMYVAARDHSIASSAKQDLGEVGWINQGEVIPELDKVIFTLEPGVVGGPVETRTGWYLVKVLEVKDANYTDFADRETQKLVLRTYMHEKMDAYTAELRKNQFPVVVYEDRLVQLSQREADMVKSLVKQAEQPGSITNKRIEELNKLVRPPT